MRMPGLMTESPEGRDSSKSSISSRAGAIGSLA